MPRAPADPTSASAALLTPAKALTAPQKALHKLGLRTDLDLVLHLPLRYEDETTITPIAQALSGQEVQIAVTVIAQDVQFRGRRQLVLWVEDDTGACELRFFNFYPSQQKAWAVGARLRVRGLMQGGMQRYMLHPSCKAWAEAAPLPQGLTPVYPSSAGLPQAYLRRAIHAALARSLHQGALQETLPQACVAQWPVALWPLARALPFLHAPAPDTPLQTLEDKSHPAWQRLIAEELLAQQLAQQQAKAERAKNRAPVLAPQPAGLGAGLREKLPFTLTAAQERVLAEIGADMGRGVPMQRLLQGDVGSGKTVVAALAAAQAIDAGWQCALLAPTEILAQQHFAKLREWLEPLLVQRRQGVAWLVGGQRKKMRNTQLAAVAEGSAALIVGTHALLQEQVQFARLGLAVIDEQHRFGVAQRLALRSKLTGGMEAHTLMMSATPIPRTLAMSYFADLDVSTIDELPPGRTPITTKVLAHSRYPELLQRISQQLQQGRQVYWVCPLIEESETLDLTHATARYEALTRELAVLAGNARVALLHARLPAAEKAELMADWVANRIQVLVSTTVIEVGVDVPNASLMVIEHAERFGLAQLHQLRGRVGRGTAASACILLYGSEQSKLGETARARLKAMAQTHDGFVIAQQDLALRGPGEFLGARQSGAPLLRFADLERDAHLIPWAQQCAQTMWQQYPQLAQGHVRKWLGSRQDYLKA